MDSDGSDKDDWRTRSSSESFVLSTWGVGTHSVTCGRGRRHTFGENTEFRFGNVEFSEMSSALGMIYTWTSLGFSGEVTSEMWIESQPW